jgi:proteic killer suppression protein
MIESFRDDWLKTYWLTGRFSRKVPAVISSRLLDKLDLINAAQSERELACPPGNRFEHLEGRLKGWCSIRINRQWRLIFQWHRGSARHIYLDPHKYA